MPMPPAWFAGMAPAGLVLLAGCFTRALHWMVVDGTMGFAAGAVVAASFGYGHRSGMVEPVASVAGAAARPPCARSSPTPSPQAP